MGDGRCSVLGFRLDEGVRGRESETRISVVSSYQGWHAGALPFFSPVMRLDALNRYLGGRSPADVGEGPVPSRPHCGVPNEVVRFHKTPG